MSWPRDCDLSRSKFIPDDRLDRSFSIIEIIDLIIVQTRPLFSLYRDKNVRILKRSSSSVKIEMIGPLIDLDEVSPNDRIRMVLVNEYVSKDFSIRLRLTDNYSSTQLCSLWKPFKRKLCYKGFINQWTINNRFLFTYERSKIPYFLLSKWKSSVPPLQTLLLIREVKYRNKIPLRWLK